MIIQTNTCICDKCQTVASLSEQVSHWDDPVVEIPEGWSDSGIDSDSDSIFCPECSKKLLPTYNDI